MGTKYTWRRTAVGDMVVVEDLVEVDSIPEGAVWANNLGVMQKGSPGTRRGFDEYRDCMYIRCFVIDIMVICGCLGNILRHVCACGCLNYSSISS